MLYDRKYMKKPFFQERFSLVDKLIVLLLTSFVFQSFCSLFGFEIFLMTKASLSIEGLSNGYVWTVLSYAALHEGPLHLIFNLLGIHFIGRSLCRDLQNKDFVWLTTLSAILGGFLWLSFNNGRGSLIGSSAIVSGYLSLFCLTRPNQPISFLLFFILPVSLKPKVIFYGVLALEVYGFIFSELGKDGGIAHSAHLGGIVTGLLFFFFLKNGFTLPVVKFRFLSKKRVSFTKKRQVTPDFTVNFSDDSHIHNEIDRILDKINEHGFGSITDEEKTILDKAKSYLQKD